MSAQKAFYLYPRIDGIFYVAFVDPKTGLLCEPQSTGSCDRGEAERIAAEIQRKFGIEAV